MSWQTVNRFRLANGITATIAESINERCSLKKGTMSVFCFMCFLATGRSQYSSSTRLTIGSKPFYGKRKKHRSLIKQKTACELTQYGVDAVPFQHPKMDIW